MTRTITAQQRIDEMLKADFFADNTGRIATRRDVLEAMPTGPARDRLIPRLVTMPRLPETWRSMQ